MTSTEVSRSDHRAWAVRLAQSATETLGGNLGIVLLFIVTLGGQGVWAAFVYDYLDTAEVIALEGLIIAIVFGVLAVRLAQEHEKELGKVSGELDHVSDRLESVAENVLTRTIGVFPHFVRHIPDLLERATKSVRVMCDNPGYGVFSNGQAFDRYLQVLKGKIADPDVEVDLMFLDQKERKELHLDQVRRFANSDSWTNWAKTPETQKLLLEFVQRARKLCYPAKGEDSHEFNQNFGTIDSREKYVELLAAVNRALLARHFYGADRRRVLQFRDDQDNPRARHAGPSIYFWMRDGQEAIFALAPLGIEDPTVREIAFQTHDPNLLNALNGIFTRYGEAAVAVE